MLIFLIGFMGCGKTTIGKKLAIKLGYEFIDMDDYIEEKEQMTIPEIFQKFTETGFRKVERSALDDLIQRKNTIVATGGGLPCFFDNIKKMNQNGLSVYLKVEPAVLAKRLIASDIERPLIKGISNNKLISYIENKLSEREPFYLQAEHVINNDYPNSDKTIDTISTLIKN